MKENRFYSEIMNINESDDIKEIVKRWSNFSKNKPKLPYGSPIVLPDMLWIAKSGYGKTNLLRLISEYLYEENLIRNKFIEESLVMNNPNSTQSDISEEIEKIGEKVLKSMNLLKKSNKR